LTLITNAELSMLCVTAAGLGVGHTALGPDHTLPFIALSRARQWGVRRTILVTVLCGIGHVAGSVLIGLVGIGLGLAVLEHEALDAWRGRVAGWLLLGTGLTYLAWGVHRAIRNRPHTHLHAHADGTVHRHEHVHDAEHVHVHDRIGADGGATRPSRPLTAWMLFIVLVLGPCKSLIPLLIVPASHGGPWTVAVVAAVFGAATILTMTTIVVAGCWLLPVDGLGRFSRFGHAAAGLVLSLCGVGVTLGL